MPEQLASITVRAMTAISVKTLAARMEVAVKQALVPTVVTMEVVHQQLAIRLPNSHSINQLITGDPIPSLTSHAPQVRPLPCKFMWQAAAATTRISISIAIAPTVGFALPVVITAPEVGSTILSTKPAI